MSKTSKTYAVNFWCSHPDLEQDDCATGEDFADLATALAFFNLPISDALATWTECETRYISHVQLDGPDVSQVREVATYDAESIRKERDLDDRNDSQEYATQMGMAYGTAGYNDAMGY